MNSEEFITGLSGDDLGNMMIHFFDEIMVLYNLVGDRADVHVSADDTSSAKFYLRSDNKDDALRIYNNLNRMRFTIYNMDFIISMDLNDSGVIMTRIEKVI